ncbi:hypothetical protein HDU83_001037 [Entophlyctis luteolus]|nr:hypothetical protein HDU83_001037 [Entophlyctis luteolus]
MSRVGIKYALLYKPTVSAVNLFVNGTRLAEIKKHAPFDRLAAHLRMVVPKRTTIAQMRVRVLAALNAKRDTLQFDALAREYAIDTATFNTPRSIGVVGVGRSPVSSRTRSRTRAQYIAPVAAMAMHLAPAAEPRVLEPDLTGETMEWERASRHMALSVDLILDCAAAQAVAGLSRHYSVIQPENIVAAFPTDESDRPKACGRKRPRGEPVLTSHVAPNDRPKCMCRK